MFIAAFFLIAKIWKKSKCLLTDTWIKKCGVYNGILFSHENGENPAICKDMDEPGGHHAKWNMTEKDKYCMVSFICGLLKIRKQILQNRE